MLDDGTLKKNMKRKCSFRCILALFVCIAVFTFVDFEQYTSLLPCIDINNVTQQWMVVGDGVAWLSRNVLKIETNYESKNDNRRCLNV